MKAGKVLKLLNITRPTLCKYVQSGKIKTTSVGGGQYDYDDESVYEILNGDRERGVLVYIGVHAVGDDVEKSVKQFLKDAIGQKTCVIRDSDGTKFGNVVKSIMCHELRELVVSKEDHETLVALRYLETVLTECGCRVRVLDSDVGSVEWRQSNM